MNTENNYIFIRGLEEPYTLEFKDFFDVSLAECIERDSKQENSIGEKVITETYDRYKDIIKKLKNNG